MSGLIVYSIYMGYWYWGAPDTWDLNEPGLRKKWEAGWVIALKSSDKTVDTSLVCVI